jgi:FtsH-binding integral membrane protein
MAYQYPSDALAQAQARERSIMSQTYLWMTAGLLVTGAIASLTANSPTLLNLIYGSQWTFMILVIVEIGLVVGISAGINRLSPAAATGLFLLYSGLNGLTLASIFLVFTNESIASTFFITAGTFAVMSVIGYTTKRDLTSLRGLLFMGLIGFFLGSLVNFFLANETFYWILTYAGIAVFIGLIAYDTQKLKRISASMAEADNATTSRMAILCALTLYLDFINLFLLLLRIFGRRG